MKIKKILAVAAVLAMAALGTANAGMTAFAEDDIGLEEVENEEIHKGDGYYIAHVSYRIDPEAYGDNLLFGGTEGRLNEGETRESVENEIIETARSEAGHLVDKDPDKYGFAVYLYFYDDYDLTPEEFFDFVNKDIAERDAASGFADNYNAVAEDEPEAIYDEPHKGEGYYIYHVSFHDGVPEIHDVNGDAYDFWVDGGGYMQEGETREDIENSVAEDMRDQLASMDVNPDDYAFDVYAYYFDDYDLTPTEFNNFVIDDIFRRDDERDKPVTDVPNPVTGAGLPCSAAVLAVLSVAGIFAVNKK